VEVELLLHTHISDNGITAVRHRRTVAPGAWRWVALVASLAACAGCQRDEPCLAWIDIGQTYTVEVIEWFDPRDERNDAESSPYSAFARGAPGCEDELGDEIAVGDELMFEAVKTVRDESARCRPVAAQVNVPGEVLSDEETQQGRPGRRFGRTAVVLLDSGCEGEYTIGIAQVLDEYGEERPEVAESNYMLVRRFEEMSADPACSAGALARGQCTDSWFVRIRDESGALVSRDSPWR
jgi:hypothetical protein